MIQRKALSVELKMEYVPESHLLKKHNMWFILFLSYRFVRWSSVLHFEGNEVCCNETKVEGKRSVIWYFFPSPFFSKIAEVSKCSRES